MTKTLQFNEIIMLNKIISLFTTKPKITIGIDDISINDTFVDKFDSNVTPFCEPVILTVVDINIKEEKISIESSLNTVFIENLVDLLVNFRHQKNK